jgi:hypothetical protein
MGREYEWLVEGPVVGWVMVGGPGWWPLVRDGQGGGFGGGGGVGGERSLVYSGEVR